MLADLHVADDMGVKEVNEGGNFAGDADGEKEVTEEVVVEAVEELFVVHTYDSVGDFVDEGVLEVGLCDIGSCGGLSAREAAKGLVMGPVSEGGGVP